MFNGKHIQILEKFIIRQRNLECEAQQKIKNTTQKVRLKLGVQSLVVSDEFYQLTIENTKASI